MFHLTYFLYSHDVKTFGGSIESTHQIRAHHGHTKDGMEQPLMLRALKFICIQGSELFSTGPNCSRLTMALVLICVGHLEEKRDRVKYFRVVLQVLCYFIG